MSKQEWVTFTIEEIKVGDVVKSPSMGEEGIVVSISEEEFVVKFPGFGFKVYDDPLDNAIFKNKQTREVWVNVYQAYNTKEEADKEADPDRLACVKIELDE